MTQKKNNNFVDVGDNTIINTTCIRWVKKMENCLEICTRGDGCMLGINTRRVCLSDNEKTFNKLNKYFEKSKQP